MITQYRPAYYTAPRAAEFAGRSIDTKPIDVANGSTYEEIDTGRIYRFDAENKVWHEEKGGSVRPSITVESITITENGTVTAPTGKAYSPVTVNVSSATEPYVEETFNANNQLTHAKMNGYTAIRECAFYGCGFLTSVELTDSVTTLKSRCFQGCSTMVMTTLPPNLATIEGNVFYNCADLAISQIPASVGNIGGNAFANCTGLTTITFDGTPANIASNAFNGCTNLTTINVPWAEGDVANAPWGAVNATINYGV